MNTQDTIIALATAVGNSAVNIIRLSGARAHSIVGGIFHSSELDLSNITYRYMYLGTLSCNSVCDKCFCIYFRSPLSYTGEDMVELQCHGGIKLADTIIHDLIARGCRIATNGEFTKRAFMNGKLSLSQAEGIIDMINAESSAGLKSSYRMMQGSYGSCIAELRSSLIEVMAELEVSFDYPVEMEEESLASGRKIIGELLSKLENLLSTAAVGRYITNGINIAIIGAPNAGKSSLLNRIVGQDKAIVTDIAGTTRDTIEARVEYNGIILNLIDTAGIRESADIIEKIGINKAKSAILSCDAAILLVDVSCETLHSSIATLQPLVATIPHVVAYNKCDLPHIETLPTDGIEISATANLNIDGLLAAVVALFDLDLCDSNQEVLTAARHIDCLSNARDILLPLARDYDKLPLECTLIDLGRVYDLFGEINGESAREDIIDRIFSRFCLGK